MVAIEWFVWTVEKNFAAGQPEDPHISFANTIISACCYYFTKNFDPFWRNALR